MDLKLALVSAFPPGRQSLNEYGLHLAREMAERTDVSEVVVRADRLSQPEAELPLGRNSLPKLCKTGNRTEDRRFLGKVIC